MSSQLALHEFLRRQKRKNQEKSHLLLPSRASLRFGLLNCCDCAELVLTFLTSFLEISLSFVFRKELREAVTSSGMRYLPIFSSFELCSKNLLVLYTN